MATKDVAVESVFELGRNDLLELDRSALQQKIGRKLKFKERIALKLVKRNSESMPIRLEFRQKKRQKPMVWLLLVLY